MRVILHSDLNAFYASAELVRRPELRGKPVVVCGDREERHGIVLAKSAEAKAYGVQTGDPFFMVRQKCADAVEIKADFPYYMALSRQVRSIYQDYTDLVEPYGIDECWLDVSGSLRLFGTGREIAETIRTRVQAETGLTVSIGVSFNKVFAKLASDLKKPNAVTEISPENYRTVAWARPVGELLYVGRATERKLNRLGIRTIGDLACADLLFLRAHLGKWGWYLHAFANGQDTSPVSPDAVPAKHLGNSLTFYRDFGKEDAAALIYALSESLASRLHLSGLGGARSVHLWARKTDLESLSTGEKHLSPVESSRAIATAALSLHDRLFPYPTMLRAIGVSIGDFVPQGRQLGFFDDEREVRLDRTVERLRNKYGHSAVGRANCQTDKKIATLDAEKDHVIHPEPFFRNRDN